MWPQLVMLGLLVFATTGSLLKHGEPKGDYNFWLACVSLAIEVVLLGYGGFWRPFGW